MHLKTHVYSMLYAPLGIVGPLAIHTVLLYGQFFSASCVSHVACYTRNNKNYGLPRAPNIKLL